MSVAKQQKEGLVACMLEAGWGSYRAASSIERKHDFSANWQFIFINRAERIHRSTLTFKHAWEVEPGPSLTVPTNGSRRLQTLLLVSPRAATGSQVRGSAQAHFAVALVQWLETPALGSYANTRLYKYQILKIYINIFVCVHICLYSIHKNWIL